MDIINKYYTKYFGEGDKKIVKVPSINFEVDFDIEDELYIDEPPAKSKGVQVKVGTKDIGVNTEAT